jgi:hypothetical protein
MNIREDKFSGIHVMGLTEYLVSNEAECINLMKRGEKNRITRATYMN